MASAPGNWKTIKAFPLGAGVGTRRTVGVLRAKCPEPVVRGEIECDFYYEYCEQAGDADELDLKRIKF
jgi:hypothetical protein